MNEDKKIKKYLKLIKRKGDLYDVISKKRNATPESLNRKLLKYHTIILSRIAYLTLVLTRRVKNQLAPVNKVKKAQDSIRECVGLPIDIFRTKNLTKPKEIGVIFSDYNINKEKPDELMPQEDLIKNLKKLAEFCKTYEINNIYLEKHFLKGYLSKDFLYYFSHTNHAELLNHEGWGLKGYKLIKTDLKNLLLIIDKLEDNKYDFKYISELGKKIEDEVITDAIDEFISDKDGKKIMSIVKSRLNRRINLNGTKKDREYGKIHETYELGEKFLKKRTIDKNGKIISQTITTLYNYLGADSYSHLEKKANNELINQEENLISLLYLNLLGEKEKEKYQPIEINSIYDYIYQMHNNTKIRKKIPWIKTFSQKLYEELPASFFSVSTVVFTYFLVLLLQFIPNHLPINPNSLAKYNKFFDDLEKSYESSYDFEKNTITKIKQAFEKLFPKKTAQEITKYIEKETNLNSVESKDNKVAEIEWFTEEKIPVYFINEYATSGHIFWGKYNFSLRSAIINSYALSDARPMFQIKTAFSKESLSQITDDYFISIPLKVYPIGDDFVITEIYIKDESDPTKYLKIDYRWFEINRGVSEEISKEEMEILNSMASPMIYYVYGIDRNRMYSHFNTDNISYCEGNYDEVKDVIKEGLNLEEDATDEEINQAIASKEYTSYPMYNKKFDIEEIDFFKEIATLEKIDAELAGILTACANENSIYVSGYKNANGDDYITTDEAYVWVIDNNGDIIDFLANFQTNEEINTQTNKKESNNSFNSQKEKSTKKAESQTSSEENNIEKEQTEANEKDSKIKEIFNTVAKWGKRHHIPYYIAGFIAILIINKIFGERIRLKIKIKKADNMLNDEEFPVIYTELMEFIYGEESIPIKRTKEETLRIISKDFYAFDEEAIDELIDEINGLIKSSQDKQKLKRVANLLKMLPFLKEYKEEIRKYKPKKLVLGGTHER